MKALSKIFLLALSPLLLPAQAVADGPVELGGFIRIYAMSSDVSLPRQSRGAQRLWVPHIPLEGKTTGHGDRTNLHAKESRVWLRSALNLGDQAPASETLGTYVEFDFNEEAEDYQPRLRHAYGTLGNLLVGQTYTSFTNTSALADIEAAIAVGDIVTRQPLLRWSQPLPDDRYQLVMAVEAAESRTLSEGSTVIQRNEHETPADLVLRLDRRWVTGNWSVAALTRRIELPDTACGALPALRGNAISVAGRINTGVLHNLRFMVSHGNGLARHVTLSTYGDAAVAADGRRQLITVSSAMVAYQHYWTQWLRSTAAYSWSKARLPAWTDGTQTRGAAHGNVNLVWTLRDDMSLGLEAMLARREAADGRDGQLKRLQATLRFNF